MPSLRRWSAVAVLATVAAGPAGAHAKFTYSGLYNAWAQSQHAFKLDAGTYRDQYVVQVLRLQLAFAPSDNLKAVTRLDLGQGWWGVDNEDRSFDRTGQPGASALFDFKDTNFLLHVDQAYAEYAMPRHPVTWRIGRQQYALGNRLLVDNNYDGIQVDLKDPDGDRLSLGWALVSEGGDNLSDLHGAAAGGADNRDADLLYVDFANRAGALAYDAFAFYYSDGSTSDGSAYIPDGLNYAESRFSAQPTTLVALGMTWDCQLGDLGLSGEVDYLTGKDDIDNATHGTPQRWDLNDGNLSGYNLYLKGGYPLTPALTLGAVAGVGSGDDDVTQGPGNVNKLRTSGFFYLTEIWEDSIMPDEEGITPQGLGAPNVRGYRELENTTAVQVNGSYKATARLTLSAAATYLKATQEIPAWTGDTPDYTRTAGDLGREVDASLAYQLDGGLATELRGGVFLPGDAAGYLINGHAGADDPAWELKGIVTARF